MTSPETLLELRCPNCPWREVCDIVGMRAWLYALGMLRRATDPPPEIVVELFRKSRERFECPDCDTALLIEQPHDTDWPETRKCDVCGTSIAAARLAVMPNAVACAACQEKLDRGEVVGEAEYCEQCGGILVMRQASAGITRYELRCGDCGR